MRMRWVRMKIRDEIAKYLLELFVRMLLLRGTDERLDSAHDAFGKDSVSRPQDLWMVGGEHVLRTEEHFLVELLAGAHAGELNLDVGTDG